MAQANGISKLVGSAGTLLGVAGVLIFFSAVFSFTPRIFVLIGVASLALSYIFFWVEESADRRNTTSE